MRFKRLMRSIIVSLTALVFFFILYLIVQDLSFSTFMEDIFTDIYDHSDQNSQKAAMAAIMDTCSELLRPEHYPRKTIHERPCVHFVTGLTKGKDAFVRLFLEIYSYEDLTISNSRLLTFDKYRLIILGFLFLLPISLLLSLYMLHAKDIIQFMYQFSFVFTYVGVHFTILPLGVKVFTIFYPVNTSYLMNNIIMANGLDVLGQHLEIVLPLVLTNMFPTVLLAMGITFFLLGSVIRKMVPDDMIE